MPVFCIFYPTSNYPQKMAARPDIIAKVNQFVQQLLAQGLSLDRAILFGSHVNGNASPDSDVDVALVSDQFTGFGFENRKLFSKIKIRPAFMDIETRTFSKDYFRRAIRLLLKL